MPEERTPLDGQVWTAPSGRPMLYVRTEKRQGPDGRTEHLFVTAHDRLVLNVWLPDGEMPEEYELAADRHAVERAHLDREALVYERITRQLELVTVTAEREALAEAMRRAVAVVSPTAAAGLRRTYSEARGRLLSEQ